MRTCTTWKSSMHVRSDPILNLVNVAPSHRCVVRCNPPPLLCICLNAPDTCSGAATAARSPPRPSTQPCSTRWPPSASSIERPSASSRGRALKRTGRRRPPRCGWGKGAERTGRAPTAPPTHSSPPSGTSNSTMRNTQQATHRLPRTCDGEVAHGVSAWLWLLGATSELYEAR